MTWTCAHCGAPNEATWRVCDECTSGRDGSPGSAASTEGDALEELRAIVNKPALGRCARHPDQMAHQACLRCGDFYCDACAEAAQGGHCARCTEAADTPLAQGGGKLIRGFLLGWLCLQGRYVWELQSTGAFQTPVMLGATVVGIALTFWLWVELWRGNSWVRSLFVTIFGLAAVFGLMLGRLESAIVGSVSAAVLLLPAVNVFLDRQGAER